MRTDHQILLVRVDGPLVEVGPHRPECRDPFDLEMVREFDSVLADARGDGSIGVGTVCSEGNLALRREEKVAAGAKLFGCFD